MCPSAKPPEAADDAALMEATLERAAERCEDITPLVFDQFFAASPTSRQYFHLDDLDPQAHGRMLTEVMVMLVDQARGEGYVGPTLSTLAGDHVSYGVQDMALYRAFLDALRATLRTLLAADWTPAIDAAWARQCEAFHQAICRRRA